MKKTVQLLVAAAVMAGATMAFAGDTNIANSKHNMATVFSEITSTQICIYCHTPHNAKSSMPLWNRNVTGKTYTLYSSQTMQSSVRATGFTANSMSLFCMSCHDGSPIGGSMVVNNPLKENLGDNTNSVIAAGSKANLTANLTTTHPVNFSLQTNGQTVGFNLAGQLRNDGTSDLVWDGSVAMGVNKNFPLFNASPRGNFGVECSSCHSVHDNFNSPFLRSTMAGSALCLGCHRK